MADTKPRLRPIANILNRLRNAWDALTGRAAILAETTKTDAEAELLQLHQRMVFAVRYMKELPMAFSDDLTALGTAIQTALAAKDTAAAATVKELADAQAQVKALTDEIATAEEQVKAMIAQLTPASDGTLNLTAAQQVDPNAPADPAPNA